jgi:hypothetical protein
MADEIELSAHNFLRACYLNKDLPVQTRIKAAQIAIAHETPKLAAVAHYVDGNLGERLTRARVRVLELQAKRDAGELIGVVDGEEVVIKGTGTALTVPAQPFRRRFG